MARKLRIAVSLFFGLATVALCVLWVRSVWVSDGFNGSVGNWYCEVFTQPGEAVLGAYPSGQKTAWSTDSAPASNANLSHAGLQFGTFGITAFVPLQSTTLITLVLTVASLVSVRRFSLRTLLIATTLIAIALSLGVWLTR